MTTAPAWSIVISATLVLALSFYIRGEDACLETQWKAAERLVASGIRSTSIDTDEHWQEY